MLGKLQLMMLKKMCYVNCFNISQVWICFICIAYAHKMFLITEELTESPGCLQEAGQTSGFRHNAKCFLQQGRCESDTRWCLLTEPC